MINEILQKLGLKYEDLKDEERRLYDSWSAVLTKPDVTIDDLKKILPAELQKARAEHEKYDNTEKAELFWKAYVRVLSLISSIITTPAAEREALKEKLRKRFDI
jgi:hypothetical protein